ncbi:MAG: hypothetical protein LC722_07920 [Actinobacteria bacterium]|nr:hypothetical protein [Actinomycetota bacterium]
MGNLPGRVLALGLAIIAITGASAGVAVSRTSTEATASQTSGGHAAPPFLALWPERTRKDAVRAQHRADRGRAAEWRTGELGLATASRFVRRILGWKRIVEESGSCLVPAGEPKCEGDVDSQAYVIHRGCLVCHAVEVRVERLVRGGPDGIWSVTAVASDLAIEVPDNSVVRTDSEIFTAAPAKRQRPYLDGTRGASGYRLGGICGVADSGSGVIDEGRLEVYFDAISINDCLEGRRETGYVYAVRTDSRERVLDPLQYPGSARRARIDNLAALPVIFQSVRTPDVEVELDDAGDLVKELMYARRFGFDVSDLISESAARTFATPPNRLDLSPRDGVWHRFRIRDLQRAEGEGISVAAVVRRYYRGHRTPVRLVEHFLVGPGPDSRGVMRDRIVRRMSGPGGATRFPCQHGSLCWAVYLIVAPSGSSELNADRIQAMGLRSYPETPGIAGPGSSAYPGLLFWAVNGGLSADVGAKEALGVTDAYGAVTLYFTSEAAALAFSYLLDPPPDAIVRVVIFGAD